MCNWFCFNEQRSVITDVFRFLAISNLAPIFIFILFIRWNTALANLEIIQYLWGHAACREHYTFWSIRFKNSAVLWHCSFSLYSELQHTEDRNMQMVFLSQVMTSSHGNPDRLDCRWSWAALYGMNLGNPSQALMMLVVSDQLPSCLNSQLPLTTPGFKRHLHHLFSDLPP